VGWNFCRGFKLSWSVACFHCVSDNKYPDISFTRNFNA